MLRVDISSEVHFGYSFKFSGDLVKEALIESQKEW